MKQELEYSCTRICKSTYCFVWGWNPNVPSLAPRKPVQRVDIFTGSLQWINSYLRRMSDLSSVSNFTKFLCVKMHFTDQFHCIVIPWSLEAISRCPSLRCAILTHVQAELLSRTDLCVVPFPRELMDQPETSPAVLHPDQNIPSLKMLQQRRLTA